MLRVEKGPDYVNLVWRPDGRIKGVNVYRDGRWLASVNSPNNVYNDFSGSEGTRYELIAYGYDTAEFSAPTLTRATNLELDPVVGLRAEEMANGRVVLNWTRANHHISGWRIYRNGELWRVWADGQGYKDEIVDASPEGAVLYEVEAYHGSRTGPRMGTLGPASLEYLAPTGRSRPEPRSALSNTTVVTDLPATNARTRSLAATAERSSQTAAEERQEFEQARGEFGRSGAMLAQSGAVAWMTSGVPVVGQVAAVRAGVDAVTFIDNGLQTRRERMEATAAANTAAADLQAYEDCMASSCGRAPTPTQGGGDGPQNPPGNNESEPQVGGNEGATRPGDDGDGLRG